MADVRSKHDSRTDVCKCIRAVGQSSEELFHPDRPHGPPQYLQYWNTTFAFLALKEDARTKDRSGSEENKILGQSLLGSVLIYRSAGGTHDSQQFQRQRD